MNPKSTWQGYAIAVLTTLLVSSGGSIVYSNVKVEALRQEMKEEISKIEDQQSQDMEILVNMAVGIARIEVEVKYIREGLDRH